jgi:diacylglycerol kinase family enzyme
MMMGTVAGHAGVRICKCKEVEITPTNGYFSLDGEKMPIGKTTLSVLPRSQGIRMIWTAAPPMAE